MNIKVWRILAETPNPTIFELGACNGEFTVELGQWCHKPCRFYSFEPDPRNQALCRKRKPAFVQFFEAAIGNVTGKVPFHLASPQPNGEIGSSSLSPFRDQTTAFPWCKCEGTVEVESWRLDDFCLQFKVPFIDLIFMDIQGAERLMIEGAQEMLKHTRYIWTEFEGKTIDREGTCYQHSSSLERILQLMPGWVALEVEGGDGLLFNPQCAGNPHEPIDLLGGFVQLLVAHEA